MKSQTWSATARSACVLAVAVLAWGLFTPAAQAGCGDYVTADHPPTPRQGEPPATTPDREAPPDPPCPCRTPTPGDRLPPPCPGPNCSGAPPVEPSNASGP